MKVLLSLVHTQRAARGFTPSVSQGGGFLSPQRKAALPLSWRGSQISQRRYGGSIEGKIVIGLLIEFNYMITKEKNSIG
jgi:hypothetical protein